MDKRKTICIFIIFILVILSVTGLVLVKSSTVSGGVVCVYSDGKLIRTIEPKSGDNYTFEVISSNGGKNIIEVKDGKVGVCSADCPDKICVHTPYVSDGIQPVVCVPHRLVIQVEARRPDNNVS